MKSTLIYRNILPLKTLSIIELIFGISLFLYFGYLVRQGLYISFWSIAGPLLGLAMIRNALYKERIKRIEFIAEKRLVEIEKLCFLKPSITKIDINQMRTELKTTNGKKHILPSKLKVEIYRSDKLVAEVQYISLLFENGKIRTVYNKLKSLKV